MSADEGSAAPPVAKPDELLALHGVTAEMFSILRRWFAVPRAVPIDLAEVDSAVVELGDPVMIAALAMRKLQALHLVATPGVRTTTDVVVSLVTDLERALVQAPAMRLKLQAAATDWDLALAALDSDADTPSAPDDAGAEDPEVEHFRALHERLHDAMFAVIEASDGEIRILV